MSVPSNLIPKRVTQLNTAPAEATAATSQMLIVYNGITYQVNAAQIVSTTGVPTSRQVIAGTGLSGGGDLSADRTISITPGGVGPDELAPTGVTPDTYGSTAGIPVITVDADGRITEITIADIDLSLYALKETRVIAGTGLTGGGSLASNVTLEVDLSDATPESRNGTGSAGTSEEPSRADHVHPAVDLGVDEEVQGLLPMNNGGANAGLVAVAGGIVYSTDDHLAVGSAGISGQVLVSGGDGAYTWGSELILTDQPANYIYGGPASGPDAPTGFRYLVNADLPDTTVTAAAYGSSTEYPTFTVNSKGVITAAGAVDLSTVSIGKATNVAGGLANQLVYNSAPNTTSFVTAPTSGDTVLRWTGSAYDWSDYIASIEVTEPIASTGGTSPTLSIPASSGSADGYLSSADWTTFNAKQAAGLCVLKTGDTMTGGLNLPASTSSLVPLHLAQGTTPTTTTDGDIWFDQDGIYIKNISATHQLDADANAVGPLSKATITDNGDGTIDVSSVMVFIYSQPSWTGDFARRTVPAATSLALTSGANYLVADYNGGSPVYAIVNDPTLINNSDVVFIANMWMEGTQIHSVVVNWGLATANRINDRLINLQRYVRSSGLMLGESTGRVITVSSGLLWYGITAVAETAQTSASSNCDFYYHVAGVWTKSSVSTYNNSQYDNGTDLVTLSGFGTQYAVNWVYRYIDGSGLPKLAYVLGSGNYRLAEAQASTAPTPPSILTSQAILVGRIIVAQDASTATQIDSAFTTAFAGSTVTDHNNLSDLQGGTTNEYYHLTSAEYTGTGTGDFVRATSPTLVTPALGTPASGDFSTGTFTWPTFNQNTTGSAGSVAYTLTRGSYLTGSNFNGSAATTWAVDATSAATASKIVARDGSGNFAANVITATSFVGIDGGTF